MKGFETPQSAPGVPGGNTIVMNWLDWYNIASWVPILDQRGLVKWGDDLKVSLFFCVNKSDSVSGKLLVTLSNIIVNLTGKLTMWNQ